MIDWEQIQTVFLDMDGTLLDLHFDNYFWLTHLPKRFAEHHQLDEKLARQTLQQRIKSQEGTLNWYCIDYWTEELGLDIRQLKEEIQHLIAFRPHVRDFLATLQNTGRHVALVTNAHHKSLNLKLSITGLDRYVDAIHCSHDFGYPKEEPRFWARLNNVSPFDPQHTLMIDDSLPVLRAARAYGIKHLLTIAQPDSQQPPREIDEFNCVGFDQLARRPGSEAT